MFLRGPAPEFHRSLKLLLEPVALDLSRMVCDRESEADYADCVAKDGFISPRRRPGPQTGAPAPIHTQREPKEGQTGNGERSRCMPAFCGEVRRAHRLPSYARMAVDECQSDRKSTRLNSSHTVISY